MFQYVFDKRQKAIMGNKEEIGPLLKDLIDNQVQNNMVTDHLYVPQLSVHKSIYGIHFWTEDDGSTHFRLINCDTFMVMLINGGMKINQTPELAVAI